MNFSLVNSLNNTGPGPSPDGVTELVELAVKPPEPATFLSDTDAGNAHLWVTAPQDISLHSQFCLAPIL